MTTQDIDDDGSIGSVVCGFCPDAGQEAVLKIRLKGSVAAETAAADAQTKAAEYKKRYPLFLSGFCTLLPSTALDSDAR